MLGRHKPYFELDRVLHDGVFFAAKQLYGLTFKERKDIPGYHPDVRVFEVFDADGKSLALWYADYFARPSKSGGAWEDSFVDQTGLLGTHPVVFNVANYRDEANVVQVLDDSGQPRGFLQPSSRATSVFGTGGPRAFQFAVKLRF